MNEEFREGQVVKLRTGGPQMVISQYPYTIATFSQLAEDRNRAKCQWFDDQNGLHEEVFNIAVLDHVE